VTNLRAASSGRTRQSESRSTRTGLRSRALVYLAIGNKEEALRWLEHSYADRDGANLSWINVEPILDPLRGEPRFEALVQKVIAPKSEPKP